jgi:[ribosomal protein S18]-alanine N-acetyltransferase
VQDDALDPDDTSCIRLAAMTQIQGRSIDDLEVRPVTPEDVNEILTWRYPEPYDRYDPSPSHRELMLDPANAYHVLWWSGRLIGFCCFGPEARVRGVETDPDLVDFGLGIRPDVTGQGNGGCLIRVMLRMTTALHSARRLRVAIYNWNLRARRAHEAAGFVYDSTHGEFVLLTRPPINE